MPIPFLASLYFDGWPSWLPEPWWLVKTGSAVGALVLTKRYFSGRMNAAERNMHGRVVLMTGGTSGVGAAAARELARRGAQLVLLTRRAPSDPFLTDFVDDLRAQTGNELVYAEQVDLASLHSIRQFATRWIDNAPPRRLDLVVLCAATLTPPGGRRTETAEGVERTWMVNFLANFHLLGILSPALKAQPFDRDVRVVLPACSSYIGAPPLQSALDPSRWTPGRAYARSKLALLVFGRAFQKHLDAHKRPDGLPTNTRVVFADPGYARTPGMVRWLTRGSLLGLATYLVLYLVPWLVLKSADMGAQSILHAAMDEALGRGPGGRLIKECAEVDFARKEVDDEAVAKELWEASDGLIERTEKAAAKRRAVEKKTREEEEKKREEGEKVREIEALIGSIKKGKETEAAAAAAKKPKAGKGKTVKFGGKAVI